ncbi:MAG: ABC transporter ATP-binding protein/permease [Clostridia bacterium]|nr:ABC transporter ATP-binding protein/permease [Clostridia bacterium]
MKQQSKDLKPVSPLRVFGFTFGFARPHMLPFMIGLLLYTSQQVTFTLLNSTLFGGVTRAIVNGNPAGLLITGLIVLGMLVGMSALLYVGVLLYTVGGLKTLRRLQTKIFRSFVNADAEGRAHSGEQLSALNNDVAGVNELYDGALPNLLMWVFPIVTLSVTVFAIEWRVGLLTVVAGLFAMGGQYLFAKPLAKIAKGTLEAVAEATKTVGDIFSGGIIIRVFSLQTKLQKMFGHSNDQLLQLGNREAKVSGAQKLFSGISQLLTTGGVFVVGSLLVSRDQMSLVTLMTLVPMCGTIAEALANIGQAWAGMQVPLEAGKRIYALLDGDNHVEPLSEKKEPIITEGYRIEAKNLTFSFKNAEKPILAGVNLAIEENQLAAFVGASGGGKSTLLKLIAGLYDRDHVSVTIGGKTFNSSNIETWRGHFSYVDQSCALFNLTIAENIALGKEGATIEEVKAAAAEADSDTFIMALPQGYDTPVGEVGGMLSGGQRQRIAIARALIRRSPVLVFDEATSALDAKSEGEVIATINRLRANHTILMATHNLASIEPDVTFRVEDGGVGVV